MSKPDGYDPGHEDARILAERAGADAALVRELIGAGLVTRGADGTFGDGAARRVRVIGDLVRSGIPGTLLVEALRAGTLNMDFVDQPSYDRFSAYEPETLEDVSRRMGVPVELLLVIREASGSPAPVPTDRVRAIELGVVPFLERALRFGVRPEHLEQTLRLRATVFAASPRPKPIGGARTSSGRSSGRAFRWRRSAPEPRRSRPTSAR